MKVSFSAPLLPSKIFWPFFPAAKKLIYITFRGGKKIPLKAFSSAAESHFFVAPAYIKDSVRTTTGLARLGPFDGPSGETLHLLSNSSLLV